MLIPIVPPVPVITPEGDFLGPLVDAPEGEVPILSDLGDLIEGAVNGIGEIIDFAVAAFDGAVEVLGYIKAFIPSFELFEKVLPGTVFSVVATILGVCASLITFKVVSYFA